MKQFWATGAKPSASQGGGDRTTKMGAEEGRLTALGVKVAERKVTSTSPSAWGSSSGGQLGQWRAKWTSVSRYLCAVLECLFVRYKSIVIQTILQQNWNCQHRSKL